jgi:predicted dithiol-disulfide oxidoreductase (DUF899 family)
MFGPDCKAGCPSRSAIADGFDRSVVHLANHDVTLRRCRWRRSRSCRRTSGGWIDVSWASSLGSDFNFDFNVSVTAEQTARWRRRIHYERSRHVLDAKPEAFAEGPASCGHGRN